MGPESISSVFAVGLRAPWKAETNNRAASPDAITDGMNNLTIHQPAYILYLPRELLDKIFSKLSQGDHKSLRVACGKFEEILNPVVFQRIHLSKSKKDRMFFYNFTATPKIAAHVKELVWFELAEDDMAFLETAMDTMPQLRQDALRDSIQHDNAHTLQELSNMASTLFWLPSVPKQNAPLRAQIEAERTRVLNEWFPHFYRALAAMPKLDTFTSRPMPAHHVLSWPSSKYKFVAYLFQMDVRSDIQGYQRNDGLFSMLLPAMARLEGTIKHLHWADESYGTSSSIMRLRYINHLAFMHLKSLDLCLCLPMKPVIPVPFNTPLAEFRKRVTCWKTLGECIHRAQDLSDISLCFEMANPKVGIDGLFDALYEVLFDEKVRLPGLTRLSLSDGPRKRFFELDMMLGKFLVRYGPQLRHLSFRRWPVYGNLLYRLWSSEQFSLDGIKIDNGDFEAGADIRESDLRAFLNHESHTWPLPVNQNSIRSTIGTDGENKETLGICDWANPKFADIPEGMDFCTALMGEDAPSEGEDDEDDDFVPSELTDDTDSESYFDLHSDYSENDNSAAQTPSGSNNGSRGEAGMV